MNAQEFSELDFLLAHNPANYPAAAMQVLEKLASKTAVAIYQGETTGKWYVDVASENSNDPVFSEWAETLPLAICKAAKAYFEFHAKTQGQPE